MIEEEQAEGSSDTRKLFINNQTEEEANNESGENGE